MWQVLIGLVSLILLSMSPGMVYDIIFAPIHSRKVFDNPYGVRMSGDAITTTMGQEATVYPPFIEAYTKIMQALDDVKHNSESIERMKTTIDATLPDAHLLLVDPSPAQLEILEKIRFELDKLTLLNVDDIVYNIKAIVRELKPPIAVDFKLPDTQGGLRIRPAAQEVDGDYVAKYSKALEKMRNLPDDDPRSFNNQADVHCIHCSDGYHCLEKNKTGHLVGLPNLGLSEIHKSWLFFPFHRAYLYFFERILGKLIDDPNFAIPYWNWDHPDGMVMPSWFNDPNSPFYDPLRNPTHFPPTVIELDYNGRSPPMSKDEQIAHNLRVMYRQMVTNGKNPTMFLGDPYRPGHGPGSVELQPHNTVHRWTGSVEGEDMGLFYSAARDPIFYPHHANMDRIWSIWKSLSPKNIDFKDNAFLNSYFYFYDENCQLVKIYVKDVLGDTKKLGYDYQPMDLPWLNYSRPPGLLIKTTVAAETSAAPAVVTFPKSVDHIFRVNLKRLRKSRSKKEKEDEEEILVVELKVDMNVYSKFDVYVNINDDEVENPANAVGSFVNLPHKHNKHKVNLTNTTFKLGLTDVIEDLGADDDEGIDVTFVPRTGTESMVIQDVRIEFLS